jgi:hypothetical protein
MLVPKITDDKYNIQLSSTDLLSCQQVNQVFMCDLFGVMSKTFEGTCLGALYMQKYKEAQKMCSFKVVPVEKQLYQLRKGHFVMYLPTATTAYLKCQNVTHTELHLPQGTQQVTISLGCQGSFAGHIVISDYSVRLDSEILHYNWNWDPITSLEPGEFEEISHVVGHLRELKLHHPALRLAVLCIAQLHSSVVWAEHWILGNLTDIFGRRSNRSRHGCHPGNPVL